MNRYFKIVVLLILPFLAFGQKFRSEIQDYNSVVNLRNETLAPKKNDKAFIQTTKHLYSYDWGNTTSSDDGLKYIVQTLGSYRWVCLNCHLRVELSQDSILLQYDANNVLVQRDTIRLLKGADKFHSNIVGTASYDPLLPLSGWVAPSSPITGNTVEVKFTDGTVGNYTFDGTDWVLDFVDEWFEKRICLNTATPTFTPSNLLMPTVAEVQAWTLANVAEKDRLNGTHVVYFIAGQGGDCENPDYTWVLNKGSELVTRTQNSILTLPNYTALRTLTKYNHDIVIVDDWTYTGPDGNTYTTLGGIFKRIHDRTITENGGTNIIGLDGTMWERDWDKIHVQPEWWECGGYDSFGNIYVSKDISVGGKIDGIYSEVDRINNAQQVGEIVQLQARVYEIDASLTLKNVQGVDGHYSNSAFFDDLGSVIKDKNIPNTTITANYTAGSTTITVASTTGLRCGQYVTIARISQPQGGQGFNESVGNNSMLITGISGNVITILTSSTVNFNASVGDKFGVLKNHRVITNFTLKNILFDGQWQSDYINYDWRLSAYLRSSNATAKDNITDVRNVIEYCKFKNIPSECLNSGHIYINACSFYNIGGGVFHHGTDNYSKYKNHIQIQNVLCDSIVLLQWSKAQHEEAIFTFSNNSQNVFINNVRATNVGGRIIGDMSIDPASGSGDFEEDGNIWIDNCYFEGVYYPHHTATPSDVANRKITFDLSNPLNSNNEFKITNRMSIKNSSFVNTGDITIKGQSSNALQKGLVPLNIDFQSCLFTNVRIHGESVAAVSIKDCKFYHRPNYGTFTDFTFKTNVINQQRSAFIHFTNSDDITVEGCLIEGDKNYNEFLNYGICFEPQATFRKDASGVNTKVFYSSKLRAINNVVTGCSFGIGFVASPTDNNSLYFTTNWNGIFLGCEVKGNTMILEKNAENLEFARNVWGLYLLPGVNASDNYIQFPEVLSAGLQPYGIVAIGITNADKSLYSGSVIKDNKIVSNNQSDFSIQLLHPRYFVAYFNNILINNITVGNVANTTNHYLQGNIKQSTVLPIITTPYNIPDEIYLFKNKGVY